MAGKVEALSDTPRGSHTIQCPHSVRGAQPWCRPSYRQEAEAWGDGAFLQGPQSPKRSLLGFEPRPGYVRDRCPPLPYCHCFSGLQSGQKLVPSFGHDDCRVPVSTSSDGPSLRGPELSQAIDAGFFEQWLPVLGVDRGIGLSGIACAPSSPPPTPGKHTAVQTIAGSSPPNTRAPSFGQTAVRTPSCPVMGGGAAPVLGMLETRLQPSHWPRSPRGARIGAGAEGGLSPGGVLHRVRSSGKWGGWEGQRQESYPTLQMRKLSQREATRPCRQVESSPSLGCADQTWDGPCCRLLPAQASRGRGQAHICSSTLGRPPGPSPLSLTSQPPGPRASM